MFKVFSQVVAFNCLFLATHRPCWLSRSTWTIDEYKSASWCLFLVLFWRPVNSVDFPDQREWSTNIKARVVVFFLSFFGDLSEGVSGRLPDWYLDEGQSEFPDPIASCCLFLVLFLATKNGEAQALSEEVSDHFPRFRWRAVRILTPLTFQINVNDQRI